MCLFEWEINLFLLLQQNLAFYILNMEAKILFILSVDITAVFNCHLRTLG